MFYLPSITLSGSAYASSSPTDSSFSGTKPDSGLDGTTLLHLFLYFGFFWQFILRIVKVSYFTWMGTLAPRSNPQPGGPENCIHLESLLKSARCERPYKSYSAASISLDFTDVRKPPRQVKDMPSLRCRYHRGGRVKSALKIRPSSGLLVPTESSPCSLSPYWCSSGCSHF